MTRPGTRFDYLPGKKWGAEYLNAIRVFSSGLANTSTDTNNSKSTTGKVKIFGVKSGPCNVAFVGIFTCTRLVA
jgi:hypothetical protein